MDPGFKSMFKLDLKHTITLYNIKKIVHIVIGWKSFLQHDSFMIVHLPVPTFTGTKSLMRADKNQHLYRKIFQKTTQHSIKSYPTTLNMHTASNMYKHVHHTCTSIFDEMIFKNCVHTLLSYQSVHCPFFYEHIIII